MQDVVTPVISTAQNVNWAVPTWDLFIVLTTGIAVFLYGFTMGRDKMLGVMVSIYMALGITSYSPLLDFLNQYGFNVAQNFAFKLISYWIIFVMLSVFFSRSVMSDVLARSGKWWHLIVFNLLHIGLLISITLTFLPPEAIANLHYITRQIFISNYASVAWILAPLFFLIVLKPDS